MEQLQRISALVALQGHGFQLVKALVGHDIRLFKVSQPTRNGPHIPHLRIQVRIPLRQRRQSARLGLDHRRGVAMRHLAQDLRGILGLGRGGFQAGADRYGIGGHTGGLSQQ
ncbi:hypothetical protein D3C76_786380 [compost metagenome]